MVGKEDEIADTGESRVQKQKMASEYEQSREERIKENLERMRKLGIFDLSLKFKSIKPNKTRKTLQRDSPLPPPQPTRRSSRLQNATPVSYSEMPLGKSAKSLDFEDDLLKEAAGSKPEIYTEEHEKLLGSTDMSWTLFVDGYGKDGKRIYDPVRGKTCHQCRQKTLGRRTQCSKCNMVQGQFCGDCLFMRYGEHVIEANQNPDWICPVCRGICNCSLCRQAKGWAPTGPLYKKTSRLGYKSVAHYLIQTRQAKTDPENNSPNGVPAKRSLPFSDVETASVIANKESSEACNETQAEEKRMDYEPSDDYYKVARDAGKDPLEKPVFTTVWRAPQVLLKPCSENDETNPKVDKEPHLVVNVEHGYENAALGVEITSKLSDLTESSSGQKELYKCGHGYIDNDEVAKEGSIFSQCCDRILGPETSPKSKKNPVCPAEPIPDSIAGRLRGRHCRSDKNEMPSSDGTLKVQQTWSDVSDAKCCDSILAPETSPKSKKRHVSPAEPIPESIGGRLRGRPCRSDKNEKLSSDQNLKVPQTWSDASDAKPFDTILAPETSPKSKRKRQTADPIPDSIAGRLRQRRAKNN